MKNKIIQTCFKSSTFFLTLSLIVVSGNSFARSKASSLVGSSPGATTVHYSQAGTEDAGAPFSGYAVGLSTLDNSSAGYGSLSFWLGLNAKNAIQFFLSQTMNPLSQSQTVGVGAQALFKHSILEHGNSGLHVGGGLGLAVVSGLNSSGAVSSYLNVNITGVAGIHFEVPGVSHLKVHLDAGPSLVVSTSGRAYFSLANLSPVLGLSVLYSL